VKDVVSWSARQVLAAFVARELSPVEYLGELFTRIDGAQPSVNALGDQYRDDALVQAKAAADRYANGQAAGRLDGLPTIVKDETEIAGRRTTNGSLLWQNYVSDASDPIVERLLTGGAVVHGRGLTPEFSIPFWTHSRLWGVTRNPWNLADDVGGSSGGSAAAVASGMTPWATGSDIGGSIRVPASCCGVVGYLPPSGRIPVAGAWGRDDWSRVGPITRTVADAALMVDVASGRHIRDHFSLPERTNLVDVNADVRGKKVALSLDLGDWPVTPEVMAAVSDAARALEEQGAIVTPVDVTIERDLVRQASNGHNGGLFAASCEAEIAGREDQVNPYTRAWLDEVAADRCEGSFFRAREVEAQISERVDRVLAEHDVLLCPVMAVPALAAGVDYTQQALVVDGVERDSFHDIHLAEVFNITNRCPVLVVPAGRAASGTPIGVQIVAGGYDDETAFAIGLALEQAHPWPLVAPVAPTRGTGT
jgi:aspartyl-tRNA(Asn)/glutamyl-tRNA(Gln) amidotransferase subunit A